MQSFEHSGFINLPLLNYELENLIDVRAKKEYYQRSVDNHCNKWRMRYY